MGMDRAASRFYRLLLRLYPARFREEYAGPMERLFEEERWEARGRGGRALFYLGALADLLRSIPVQIAREMGQDLRYAARSYRTRRLSTVLAFAALALAIGASTGIFSVLNAMLLRSLPFRDAERLVAFEDPPVDIAQGRSAFYDWRAHNAYLQDAALYWSWENNLSLARSSVRARVCRTNSTFFSTLGVEPALGRGFAADDDVPGRGDVAIIGHALSQQLFGGDARALGAGIRLDGKPVTIIGVAPQGFEFPDKTEVWTPSAFNKGIFGASAIGRLKPGLSHAQASARFAAEAARLHPREGRRMVPLREDLAGPVAQASLALMAAVAFVLLIACANVAHLLLSRTAERGQELAIRAALGASRARLVQQLITESTALTVAAAAAGLVVAHWVAQLATLARPAQLSALARRPNFSLPAADILDWRVIAFALGLALLTGVVFGALPASLMGRMLQPEQAMRSRHGSRGAGRMRASLIGMQAAFTVALLAGAVTMSRSFLKLTGTDLNFRPERVVTLNVSLEGTRYQPEAAARQYYADVLQRLRAVPGVESAGAVGSLPLMVNARAISALLQTDAAHKVQCSVVPAGPGYFGAVGTEVVEGRDFTEADARRSEPLAIVNQALARELGIPSGLAGKTVFSFWGKKNFLIVGVVRTERYAGPARTGGPRLYYLLDQKPMPFATFAARTRGRPEPYLAASRNAAQQVDPQVPVYDVKTLGQRLDDLLAGSRFYTTAVLFFALFALLLAVVGVYGVAVHSVAQRTHEIGVRIAVGALPGDVRRMLLRQSAIPLSVGTLAGVAAALGLGRFLRHLVENAQPVGVWTCAAAGLILAAVAAAAVWSATRRITRMDPLAALRTE
jgi:predicted permease